MAMECVAVIQTSHEDGIVALAFNRFKKEIFSAAQGEKHIQTWDARTRHPLRCLHGHKGCITGLVFDDETRALFSISLDGTLLVWSEKETPIHMVEIGGPLMSMAWDADLRLLALGERKTLHLFTVYEEKLTSLLHEPSAAIEKLSAENRDERSNNGSGITTVFERITEPLVGPEYCTSDNIQKIVCHGGKIIVAGYDGCLCIYDIEKPRETFRRVPKAHASAISSLDVNPVENLILTGSYDGTFSLWSLEGRCGDSVKDVSDERVMITYIASTYEYWVIGRGGQISIFDPSGPTDITNSVIGTRNIPETSSVRFAMLHAPDGNGVLLGATEDRKIVAWMYRRTQALRIFRSPSGASVECAVGVLSQDGMTGKTKTDILAGDALGHASLWQYEAEKCSNVFHPEELPSLRRSAVLCVVHIPSKECFASGHDDGTITLQTPYHDTDAEQRETSATRKLYGHTDRVTSLAVVNEMWLVSGSFDQNLRMWDLTDSSAAQVIENAHSAPIHCLESVSEMQQLASCSMNHLVKIWSTEKDGKLDLLFVLNHRIVDASQTQIPIDPSKSTVATRATIDGEFGFEIRSALEDRDIVQEAIEQADIDVPEVTQVRWVEYKRNWITAANDGMLRLWNGDGELVHSFRYKGGAVQCLFVDKLNELILLSTLDMTVSVFVVDHPIPIATYRGHEDIVRSILYIPERDVYMTGSWDGTLRLWLRPYQGYSPSQCPVKQSSNPSISIDPGLLNTDYSQLWKTLQLMEEYEQRYTGDWSIDRGSLLPSFSALPDAPAHLESLLEDVNKRTLDHLLQPSPMARNKASFGQRKSLRRTLTRHRV